MPRTRGRGRKAGKSRRSTLRGRTKNRRGGWKTCFNKNYEPYLVKKYCNIGDTPDDYMHFGDSSRWLRWYDHPAQIKEYSEEDQKRLEDPELQELRNRFPSPEVIAARKAEAALKQKNRDEREAAESRAERMRRDRYVNQADFRNDRY